MTTHFTEEEKAKILSQAPEGLMRESLSERLEEPITIGTVGFYYKPVTSYPARIYVLIDDGNWQDRNKYPMGLSGRQPFLLRRMTTEEAKDNHLGARMQAHQYENWDDLLADERKETQSDVWVSRLAEFQKLFALAGKSVIEQKGKKAKEAQRKAIKQQQKTAQLSLFNTL